MIVSKLNYEPPFGQRERQLEHFQIYKVRPDLFQKALNITVSIRQITYMRNAFFF